VSAPDTYDHLTLKQAIDEMHKRGYDTDENGYWGDPETGRGIERNGFPTTSPYDALESDDQMEDGNA